MTVYELNDNNTIKERYVMEEKEAKEKGFVIKELPQGMYKPKWNGSEWVECATEEYIKSLYKRNEIEPSEQEKLNAQLLQLNAQQQLINASLLKQIAELKGGN